MAVSILIPVWGNDVAASERRIYAPETIAAMKQNWKNSTKWRENYQKIIEEADQLLKLPKAIWDDMIPDPRIPRAFTVHIKGCPNCGEAVYKFGGYPWIISRDKPYKVQCPNCKNIYPDNDYYGYVKSDFKDKSKLVGKYSDDGWGWQDGDSKNKYWFVGYYNHWMFYDHTIVEMEALQTAYILTGKAEYARMCAYLLWRFAGFWSQYDYQKQSRYALEFDPDYTGRIVNHTWDSAAMSRYTLVFDGIRPFLLKPDAELEKLTGKNTAEMRKDIEEKLFRQAILDLWSRRLYGNFGMDHSALVRLAMLLHNVPGEPSSSEVIKRLCMLGDWTPEGETPLDYMFYNLLTTEGVPLESPSYNTIWSSKLMPVFHELSKLGKDYFTGNVRLQQMLLHYNFLLIGKRNTPAMGDYGNYLSKAFGNEANALWIAFQHYPTPEFAAALSVSSPDFSLKQPEQPDKAALKAALSQLDEDYFYRSRHLPGYGYLTVQNGNPKHPAGISVLYRLFWSHSHNGLLHFELFSHGKALTPDFGYPDTASVMDPRRYAWFANTLTHNTVVVDGRRQKVRTDQLLARNSKEVLCTGYDSGDFAEYVEVDAPELYGIKKYERSLVTIKVDDERLIAVDFFRIDGGSQHDWFFHGNTPDVTTELPLVKQPEGTLAGPDVPYGKFYDDPALRDVETGSVSYLMYHGSGYQYLFDVAKGPVKNAVTKVHMNSGSVVEGDKKVELGVDFYNLSDQAETLILAQGKLQNEIKDPASVGFMIRRRTGKNLRSNFVTVIDFGAQPGCVEKVEFLESTFERAAVRITLKNKRELIVFNNVKGSGTEPLAVKSLKLSGHTGAVELGEKGVRRMWLYGEGRIADGEKTLLATHPDFQAKVTAVDILQGVANVEDMALWCNTKKAGEERWVFSNFRPFRTAIQDKTVTLYPELPVRGKFKLKSWNAKTRTVEMMPVPLNLHRDLYLIAPDHCTTIAPVAADGPAFTFKEANAELPDEKDTLENRGFEASDYYLSEIGAGQTLTVHDSARWTEKTQK